MSSRALFVAASLATALLSACTLAGADPASPTPAGTSMTSPATEPSATPSATPSPTATWSSDQASAIQAVAAYRAVSQQIASAPSDFAEAQMTAALKKVAGPEVVKANVASYVSLKKRGLRYDGNTSVLSTLASKPSDVGYGVEVVVTHCVDQRGVRLVDLNGVEVSGDESGDSVANFNLRQYTVQRRTDETGFRVYGTAPAKGTCEP